MTQKRTWLQQQQSGERCIQILRALDERTLQRRAQRLASIVQIETPAGYYMPNRTCHLLDEAEGCFVDGHYGGCVLSLASGVEHGLRELLQKPKGISLNMLIKHGITHGVINESQAEVLRAMKDYRNSASHSDIDYLAAGKRSQHENVLLSPQETMEASAWEDLGLPTQDLKEIAAELSEEHKVGELLVQVREVIHDIFDGQPLPDRFSVGNSK